MGAAEPRAPPALRTGPGLRDRRRCSPGAAIARTRRLPGDRGRAGRGTLPGRARNRRTRRAGSFRGRASRPHRCDRARVRSEPATAGVSRTREPGRRG